MYADAGDDEISSKAAIDAVSRFAGGSDAALMVVLGDSALVESWLELSPRPGMKGFQLNGVAMAMAPQLYVSSDAISKTFDQVRSGSWSAQIQPLSPRLRPGSQLTASQLAILTHDRTMFHVVARFSDLFSLTPSNLLRRTPPSPRRRLHPSVRY